jgi:chromosomal replication initiator protein
VRRAILLQKARALNLALPEEAVTLISEGGAGSARDLESAVLRLAGHAALLDRPLDGETCRRVLREFLPQARARRVPIEEIRQAVCDYYGITLADLLSKSRARSVVVPRHVTMYLARHFTQASLEEVGWALGERDHSTVKHGVDKVVRRLAQDPDLQGALASLERRLLNLC